MIYNVASWLLNVMSGVFVLTVTMFHVGTMICRLWSALSVSVIVVQSWYSLVASMKFCHVGASQSTGGHECYECFHLGFAVQDCTTYLIVSGEVFVVFLFLWCTWCGNFWQFDVVVFVYFLDF